MNKTTHQKTKQQTQAHKNNIPTKQQKKINYKKNLIQLSNTAVVMYAC